MSRLFLNRENRTMSLIADLVFVALITFIIGFILLVAMAVINDPMWRVISMALISFGLLFLGSASKLRPVAGIIALIVGYGLDAGESATSRRARGHAACSTLGCLSAFQQAYPSVNLCSGHRRDGWPNALSGDASNYRQLCCRYRMSESDANSEQDCVKAQKSKSGLA
jgi:hypothetical protein